MEGARFRSRVWAKGINATLIEAALVDCDMLTQLCRKYSATPINRVKRLPPSDITPDGNVNVPKATTTANPTSRGGGVQDIPYRRSNQIQRVANRRAKSLGKEHQGVKSLAHKQFSALLLRRNSTKPLAFCSGTKGGVILRHHFCQPRWGPGPQNRCQPSRLADGWKGASRLRHGG
ncbi:hypothetical protein KM043_006581 [Ampulex compressa]|nr:hypothetical protein KM043_006581 [Ampulex compressa]